MIRKPQQIILFLLSTLSLVASGPEDRLAEKLFSIYELYTKDPDSNEVDQALKELDQDFPDPANIVREIESENWGNPSPDRIDQIDSLGRVIEPYSAMLVDLAYNRGGANRHRAERFVWFLPPNDTTKNILIEVSKENLAAFRALFQTGMFDEQVRQSFVQNLAEDQPFESRWKFAQLSAEWGLSEAIPTYEDALSIPFDPTQISFVGHVPAEDGKSGLSYYSVASKGVAHLGSEGQSLLPLLKERLKEIKAAFPDRYNALTAGMTLGIGVLEGRIEQQLETVINGRGAINLTYGHKPIPYDELRKLTVGLEMDLPMPKIAEAVEKEAAPDPTIEDKPAEVVFAETAEEDVEQSPNWWLWLVGVLVVVGGLGLALRRKS